MIRKKSSFLTFIFSLMPGAGEMYMGFMKRGLSLMAAFFFFIFIGAWLTMGLLLLPLPLIWFYSFFDTHNLRSTPDEEFYALEDDYILFPDINKDHVRMLQSKYRNVFAIILIVIGFSILWNNIYKVFNDYLPNIIDNILYDIGYYFPQLLIGSAIILFGFYLIRGKKKELDAAEQNIFLEDKGGSQ
ncbi:MAG: hypothetical protein K0S76_1411 [Herbinix sp.]|jgi:hypothetical protein|nr:hypothetical protein [Herbinix sp.]